MALKWSSSSATKASLVLMLLVGAVVAAYDYTEIHNELSKQVKVNGVTIGAGLTVKVKVDAGNFDFSVTDAEGKVCSWKESVPASGCFKIKVVCKGAKACVEGTCKERHPIDVPKLEDPILVSQNPNSTCPCY